MKTKEYIKLLEQFCKTELNYTINDNIISIRESNEMYYEYDIEKHQIFLIERNNRIELGSWNDERMSNVHFALLIKVFIESLYSKESFDIYDNIHSFDELRDVVKASFKESSYSIGKSEEGKLSIVEDSNGRFLIEFYSHGNRYLIEETYEKLFAFLRFYLELIHFENIHKQLKEYQNIFNTSFTEDEILSIMGYDSNKVSEQNETIEGK